jgi:hypothetical protein
LREDVLRPCVRREFGPIFEGQLENNKTGYLVGENVKFGHFEKFYSHGLISLKVLKWMTKL